MLSSNTIDGNVAVAEVLIKNGSEVNAKKANNETPVERRFYGGEGPSVGLL